MVQIWLKTEEQDCTISMCDLFLSRARRRPVTSFLDELTGLEALETAADNGCICLVWMDANTLLINVSRYASA